MIGTITNRSKTWSFKWFEQKTRKILSNIYSKCSCDYFCSKLPDICIKRMQNIWYDNKLIALNLWHVYLVVSVCWELIVTHMLYLIETTTPLISKKKFNVFMVQKGSGNNKLLPSSLATYMYETSQCFYFFILKPCVFEKTLLLSLIGFKSFIRTIWT